MVTALQLVYILSYTFSSFSIGSRAFSKTTNGCVLIGDFPGGVCTGLQEIERYVFVLGLFVLRDIWWDVFVLGLFVLSPGLRNVPDFFQLQ